jgi:hypothetical protein
MRDLYQQLGVHPKAATRDIEHAIQRCDDRQVTHAARHILLEPRRRDVYDRNRERLETIGRLRANMGLQQSPLWTELATHDFDAAPSRPAVLPSVRFKPRKRSRHEDRQPQRARPRPKRYSSALGLLVWLVLGGLFSTLYPKTTRIDFPASYDRGVPRTIPGMSPHPSTRFDVQGNDLRMSDGFRRLLGQTSESPATRPVEPGVQTPGGLPDYLQTPRTIDLYKAFTASNLNLSPTVSDRVSKPLSP